MRITSGMVMDTALRNIESNMDRVSELEAQLTSGSRIQKPSDDPIGAARSLSFQESLGATGQYLSNIDQAKSWLDMTDSTLAEVTNTVHRARELAIQAANGTNSAEDRAQILAEIEQLQQHTLSLAQAKHAGSFIFAGTKSDQPGYVQANPSTTAGAYQGNTNDVVREISPGVTMAVTSNATTTFDPVFDALNQLASGLSTNTQGTIEGSIGAFDTALDAVLTSRAQVGAKANRLESLNSRMSSVQVNLSELLSKEKDVDFAQAITNFSMAQNTYQASLKAGAQALQPSLLDYLK